MSAPNEALPYRMANAEGRLDRQWDVLNRLSEGDTRKDEKIANVEEDIKALTATVNRMFWALIMFAFTVAGSAVTVALTVGGGG